MKPSTTMFTAVTLALGVATNYLVTPSMAETFIIMPGELQEALDEVQPGDTIELSPGHYYESVVTKRAGTADKPITIHGESYRAVIKGEPDGNDHMFDVQHSYYVLDRFTIDGHLGGDEYQDKCLYVQTNRKEGESAHEIEFNGHSFKSSLNGIVISNMDIKNCGGECVRLRYFITYAQIFNNRIENCGAHDFVVYPEAGGKNGEGIYLGTSSNQWDDGKNPTNEPDESQYNHIFDNYFDTQGNEGLDIKEGSSNNVAENNYCTGQKDPESACEECANKDDLSLDARGSGNIFRFNKIEGNIGAGVRLGGHKIDGYTYGVDNEVYGNMMKNNDYAGVKATVGPQGKMCENKIEGSEPGRGDGMDEVDPSASCPHLPSMAITARAGGNSEEEEEEEEEKPEPTRAPVARPPYMSAESYRTGSRSP